MKTIGDENITGNFWSRTTHCLISGFLADQTDKKVDGTRLAVNPEAVLLETYQFVARALSQVIQETGFLWIVPRNPGLFPRINPVSSPT